MKKFRYILLSALIICCTSILFVACGKKEENKQPPKPKVYTVRYYTCGGDIPIEEWYDYDTSTTIVYPDPKNPDSHELFLNQLEEGNKLIEPMAMREDYTFLGWYEDNGYTKKYDFNTKVTKDFNLYARWSNDAAEIFSLTLSDGAEPYYTVNFCNARAEDVEIPDSYNEIPITTIAANAFDGSDRLKNITVPETIKTIGADAFKGCTNLEYTTYKGQMVQWIDINYATIYSNPAYVSSVMLQLSSGPIQGGILVDTETVKPYAFSGISPSINVTTNVKSIAAGAFEGCRYAGTVFYEGSLEDWFKIDFESYTSNPLTCANYLALNGGSYAPQSLEINVDTVPKFSLAGLQSPKTIHFASAVKTIEEGALQGAALTELVLPSTVEDVGESAFKDCNALSRINIYGNTAFSDYAFAGCKNLQTIEYNTSTNADLTTVNYDDNNIFYDAGIDKNGITLSLSMNAILSQNLFVANGGENNPKITKLNFAQGRLAILQCDEFNKMNYLGSIELPGSVKIIEPGIFDNTPWYKNHEDGCVAIGTRVYDYKGDTTNVVIPEYIEGYYNNLFERLTNMESLQLPFVGESPVHNAPVDALFGSLFPVVSYEGGVAITQSYGNGQTATFYIPQTLKRVKISGYQLTTIEDGAFSGLSCIEELDFSGCTQLHEIKQHAFYGFGDVGNIMLPEVPVELQGDVYENMQIQTIRINYIGNAQELGTISNDYENKVGRVIVHALPNDSNHVAAWCDETGNEILDVTNNKAVDVKLYGEDINLYVKFVWEPYTITLNYGYDAKSNETMNVKFGSSFTLPTPVRNAFNFLGWFLNDELFESGIYMIQDNIELVAHWSDPIFLYSDLYWGGISIDGLTPYGKTLKELVIPNSIDDKEVKGIYLSGSQYSFTSLIIDNIKTISSSFSYLNKLETVTLIGVEVLESLAFQHNANLKHIDFGDSLREIGMSAFYGCSSLTELDLTNISTIGESAFEDCVGLTDVTFGSGITQIGKKTFKGCTGLQSIVIGEDITSIGESAFEGCTGLNNVIIGDNVSSIGARAFKDCSKLTNITIGKGVTTFEADSFYQNGAFSGCTGILEVNYTGTIGGWASIDFKAEDSNPFYSATSANACLKIDGEIMSDITINCDVQAYAFRNLQTLTKVTFTGDATTVSREAFQKCTNLTSITFNTITTIETYAFDECYGLTTLNLDGSVTTIKSMAFLNCKNLTSVFIGKNVKGLEDLNFNGCENLTIRYAGTVDEWIDNVNMAGSGGTSALSYAKHMLFNGQEVTELTMDRESIPDYTFSECGFLKKLTITRNVKHIGRWAFYNCENLNEVIYEGSIDEWSAIDMQDSILLNADIFRVNGESGQVVENITINTEHVTSRSLAGYKGLKSVVFGDNVRTIGRNTFSSCKNLTSITIGNGTTKIGERAFEFNPKLTSVTIGTGEKSFKGGYVFWECKGLKEVIYQGTVEEWERIYFDDDLSNPVYYAGRLIINGKDVTELNINQDIQKYAFAGLKTLKKLTFGDNVTTIPTRAFYLCSGLTSVELRGNIETLESSAFEWCENLTSVVIGENVTDLQNGAFWECKKLNSITILSASVYNSLQTPYDIENKIIYAKTIKVSKSIVDSNSGSDIILNNTKYFTKSQSGDYYVFTYTGASIYQ